MCAAQPKIEKKTAKSLIVQGSKSFKVIDVDTILQFKSSSPACLCLSATVFMLDELIAVK